jgi:hypothetical protein
MRTSLSFLISLLLLASCSAVIPKAGQEHPGKNRAQAAAEEAFVELEGGKEVPLPGMTATPVETTLLEEESVVTESEPESIRTMDYTVRPGWFLVDTTLVFPGTVPPARAKREALQTARAAGLEQALPAKVSFTSLLSDVMDETAGAAYEKSTWSTFALSSISGHVVDEKILSAEVMPIEGNAYRYRMVMEARVVPVKGERDPSLRLELDVNERLLNEGDELVIRVRSNTAGYLYVFDFLSDNSVMLMYPNALMIDNAIAAAKWVELPTEQERARGIRFRVAAAPEALTTNETIYAVFTRQPIADLAGLINVPEGYASFSAGDASFTDFQRWLAEIPLSQRIEKAVQLHIVKDKE